MQPVDRAPDPDSLALPAFLRRLADELFHLDGRLWVSLRTLIFEPGTLTRGWREGWGQDRFLSPFRLYLLINLFFFVSIPTLDDWADSETVGHRFENASFIPIVSAWIQRDLSTGEIDRDVYEARFDAYAKHRKSAFIALVIPFLALPLKLAQRKRYFAEHIVFATHFLAWVLLLLLLVPVSVIVFDSLGARGVGGILVLFLIGVGPVVYASKAAYGFYHLSRPAAFAVGLLMLTALWCGLMIYSIMLSMAAIVAIH